MSYVTPKTSSAVAAFLASDTQVNSLIHGFGSPLNIIFPEQVLSNFDELYNVFAAHSIKGRIFYATKANKSKAIITRLADVSNANIDVASIGELSVALSSGFSADRIEATGPKNDEFLRLCLLHGVIINIDDEHEYDRVLQLMRQLTIAIKPRLLLRIAHPDNASSVRQDVRFGMNTVSIKSILVRSKINNQINIMGFSFHLAAASNSQKSRMIEMACQYIVKATDMGLSPTIINIGGGLTINYLESASEWDTYTTKLKQSVVQPNHEVMSWRNSGLGFWAEGGNLKGSGNFADHYVKQTPAQQLSDVLNVELKKFDASFGQFLSEVGVTLFIEPGRALLDQAGVTLAKVLYNKPTSSGETVIVSDMNRSNLNAQDMEYMVDPLVIGTANAGAGSGFLAGNLCLAHDFLTRRKVFFKQMPKAGDVLAFINTAGYLMDFAQSETLRQPIAKKIAVRQSGTEFNWYEDRNYSAPSERAV